MGSKARGAGPLPSAWYRCQVMAFPSVTYAAKSERKSSLFSLVAPNGRSPSDFSAMKRISSRNFLSLGARILDVPPVPNYSLFADGRNSIIKRDVVNTLIGQPPYRHNYRMRCA